MRILGTLEAVLSIERIVLSIERTLVSVFYIVEYTLWPLWRGEGVFSQEFIPFVIIVLKPSRS